MLRAPARHQGSGAPSSHQGTKPPRHKPGPGCILKLKMAIGSILLPSPPVPHTFAAHSQHHTAPIERTQPHRKKHASRELQPDQTHRLAPARCSERARGYSALGTTLGASNEPRLCKTEALRTWIMTHRSRQGAVVPWSRPCTPCPDPAAASTRTSFVMCSLSGWVCPSLALCLETARTNPHSLVCHSTTSKTSR